MAPLERGAQRLLARRRLAVAARAQQAEALVQRRRQRRDAEQRHARCRQLDRQRQAIERAAQRDDRGRVRIVEHEAAIERDDALDEQGHRAVVVRTRRRQRLIRHAQRTDAEHAFRGELERRLACDDDAQARGALVQRAHQLRDTVEQMFGVVERQQHLERRQRREQLRERRAGSTLHSERGRDRRRQHRGIADLRELDPAHAVRVGAAPRLQQVLRQQRLADATGTHERDHAMCIDERAETGQVVAAPDHRRQPRGQLRAQCDAAPRTARAAARHRPPPRAPP